MKLKNYKKINEKVYYMKLDNQLDVYFLPQAGFQEKIAIIAAKFGSFHTGLNIQVKDDVKKIPSGVAHFLEHRMFTIKNEDATQFFADLGADSNAYTSYNRTAYYFKCNEHFYENLDVLMTMISSFTSTDKQIENEKQIIIEELNMYKDDPYTKLMNTLYNNSYFEHPIKEDIGGTNQTVQSVDKELLNACYDNYYHPSNLTLVIAGDLVSDEIEDFFKKKPYFNSTIEQPKQKKLSFKHEPLEVVQDYQEIQGEVSIPLFGVLFKLPPLEKKDFLKKQIAMDMLLSYFFDASGIYTDSWLKQKIISSAIGYYHCCNIDLNCVILYNINENYTQTIDKILEVFDYHHWLMKAKDFERIKNKMLGANLKGYSGGANVAKEFIDYKLGNMDYYNENEVINAMTLDDVKVIYDEICDAKHAIVVERKDIK